MKQERQRYILIEYLAEQPLEEPAILSAFWQTFTRLFGEVNAGSLGLYVVYSDQPSRRLILRCAHRHKESVISAITLTRKIHEKPVAFCTRLTSGTLASLRRHAREKNTLNL